MNSVLLSMFSYWTQIFVLPKHVLDKVTQVCRAFLWGSSVDQRKYTPISWHTLCLPKTEGGMNIRDPIKWNMAALSKLLWHIAQKADSLWIRWVDHYYLKGRSIWDCSVSLNCSWYWKKLLKIRDKMVTSFDITNNKWLHSPTRTYTPATGYEWLRDKVPRVYWYKIIWHQNRIPKCAFITWLVMHERLLTKDSLLRFGIQADQECSICHQAEESIPHLFFDCAITKQVCADTLHEILHISNCPMIGGQWQQWLLQWKGPRASKVLVAFTVVIYVCWREHNMRIFQDIRRDNFLLVKECGRMLLNRFRGI